MIVSRIFPGLACLQVLTSMGLGGGAWPEEQQWKDLLLGQADFKKNWEVFVGVPHATVTHLSGVNLIILWGCLT